MCIVVLILSLLSEPALSMMLAPCLFASVKGGTSEKGGGKAKANRTLPLKASLVTAGVPSQESSRRPTWLPAEVEAYISSLVQNSGPFCEGDSNHTPITRSTQGTEDSKKVRLQVLGTRNVEATLPYMQAGSSDGVSIDDAWVAELCPEVVEHFARSPLFANSPRSLLPMVLSTRDAMSSVCLLKVVSLAARRARARWFVWAGTHIGAVMHGGPVPWDDDTDVLVEHAKFNEFVAALREFELPGAALVVATSNVTKHGEVKLSIANRGYSSRLVTEGPGRKYHQYWPFIDIFFYTVNISSSTGKEQIVELDLRASDEAGTLVRNPRGGADSPFSTFFPARTYMFGGLRVPGPSLQVATLRYKLQRCQRSRSNHRLGRKLPWLATPLDCCQLAWHHLLPFMHRVPSISGAVNFELLMRGATLLPLSQTSLVTGEVLSHAYVRPTTAVSSAHDPMRRPAASLSLGDAAGVSTLSWQLIPMRTYVDEATQLTFELPSTAWDTEFAAYTWRRATILPSPPLGRPMGTWDSLFPSGAMLSARVPNKNVVEIDNSISMGCAPREHHLTVIGFNAQRGARWPLIAHAIRTLPALKRADVVLLNELDVGMARSGNQHTLRLLAHALRMNYAWGLEFVELTRGTREEQNATTGRDNAIGLHGNAILSKCALSEAEVLRGPFDERYFSRDATPTNAHGYERRLGGRMALLARLQVGSTARITVGAMHKFIASGGVGNRLWARLNASAGTVLAGDQNGQLCQSFGLADLGSRRRKRSPDHTFPASCNSNGRKRGDIICSDLPSVHKLQKTQRPCVSWFGEATALSDHAFTVATLTLPRP